MGARRAPRPRPAGSRSWRGWPRWPRWLAPACALAVLLAVLLGMLAWRGIDRAAPVPAAVAGTPPAAPHAPQFFGAVDAGAPAADERRLQRRQLVERLLLADRVYCSYRSGSRYPAGSRPMAENADQNRPNAPAVSTQPMRLDGGGSDAGVQVQTSQSRIYVASGESVAMSLRALDADGKALPLVVTRALAQGITYAADGARQRPAPQVALPFADDGTGADRTADDGALTGVLAPGQTGLAGFAGTIRTEVRYNAAGKSGLAQFDVIYTPELPAVWAGPVREAVEDGSLAYILKLDVRQPGRYIVNGRVDDARGQPLALLTFNDVLGPGPNEVRLTLFGKLLRDAAPAQPLTLRDVDGWLLKDNADPDRALLPRLAGKVFSGPAHAADGFSDAEWQSEERSRYLAEFARDLNAARTRLAEFDPATPLPAGACLPPEPARVDGYMAPRDGPARLTPSTR